MRSRLVSNIISISTESLLTPLLEIVLREVVQPSDLERLTMVSTSFCLLPGYDMGGVNADTSPTGEQDIKLAKWKPSRLEGGILCQRAQSDG
jgi:hypothetical protein